MRTGFINHDRIVFQYSLSKQVHSSLEEEIKNFQFEIKKMFLFGKVRINSRLLAKLFNLRIKALQWLIKNKIKLTNYNSNIESIFEDFDRDERLSLLKENILFALRTQSTVKEILLKQKKSGIFQSKEIKLEEITYEQFVFSIVYGISDDKIAQKVIAFIDTSLTIEFLLIASFLLKDIKVSEKVIDELSIKISEAAQNYYALAVELGIIKKKSYKAKPSGSRVSKIFLSEQTELANLGLNELIE